MQPDPPPADFLIVRDGTSGRAIVASCRAHLNHTKMVLQAGDPAAMITVGPANVDGNGNPLAVPVHGCKGHMEDWPVTAG